MHTATDTRQRLVDTARDLIAASSYHAVGVQEICGRAGVQKGSFYHFFTTKHELALAAVDDMAGYFSRSIFEHAFSADIAPLARIERFFTAVYNYHQQVKDTTGHVQGCPFGNLAGELGSVDTVMRDRVDSLFRLAEAAIDQALQDAIKQGDLPPMDTRDAARAIFAYTEGLILYAKTRNDATLIRDLGKRAIQLTIEAGQTGDTP
jgi:TetR/AcrR family transcriptional repressor of nem operon